MNELFKVYLRCPPVADNGVGFYRSWLPLNTARKLGLIDFICQHFTMGKLQDEETSKALKVTEEELFKKASWADICLFQRNDVLPYISQAGGIQEYLKKPVTVDFDDCVQATRPYNPGYRSFHPNSPHMGWNIKSCGVYFAIITSTDWLADYYGKYNSNIYIYPNSIDFKDRDQWLVYDFSKSELYQKKKDEIRIGWSGSASHWENLKFIEKPLLAILKKYPQTTFYFTGLFGDLFKGEGMQNRIRTVGFTDLDFYGKLLKETNLDIALAPLTDCDFNRAKSNLRILEYATCKYPVVASDVHPYRTFKKEAILCKEKEDWYEALERLVLNEAKRKEIAEKTYRKAKKEYNVWSNCKILVSALKDIKDKYARDTLISNKRTAGNGGGEGKWH